MPYVAKVYIVKNGKNHLCPIFLTLYHLCKLKQTPFTKSVVFGKNRDGDFWIRDGFEELGSVKTFVVLKSANPNSMKRGRGWTIDTEQSLGGSNNLSVYLKEIFFFSLISLWKPLGNDFSLFNGGGGKVTILSFYQSIYILWGSQSEEVGRYFSFPLHMKLRFFLFVLVRYFKTQT